MSKGGGDTTTVQKSEPWSGLKPYLIDAYAKARNIQENGVPQYYPGATYTPASWMSQAGIDRLASRGQQGSPLQTAASNFALNATNGGQVSPYTTKAADTLWGTASGDYLNANPYLDQMFGQAAGNLTQQFNEGVMPGLNSTFGQAGRTGSGAHALAYGKAAGELGDTLGTLSANIYGNNYATERQNQLMAGSQLGAMGDQQFGNRLDAAKLGMGVASQDYNDIQQMLNAGQLSEGYSNQILQDDMNRFNYYQNLPQQNMSQYVAWLNGIPGANFASGTSSANNGGGGVGGALGGGLAGGSLASMMGLSGPLGWGLAGLGALGGLLG